MKINIYASYDVFPSAKGASTHIKEMILESSNHCDELQVYCLRGNVTVPIIQKDKNIFIKRFYNEDKLNYLQKASLFSKQIFFEVQKNKKAIQIGHFRDVWSGMGMVLETGFKTIFEVNALTSIELPCRYPNLTPVFLEKIKTLEKKCLDNTDVIITPSSVTKKYIQKAYKIQEEKIVVIPNGAHIPDSFERPKDIPEEYIIYFGAIQPWQGVDVLLKAMTYLSDFSNLKLVICLSVKEKMFKPFKRMVEKLNIEDKVIIKTKLPKSELYNYIHYAKASIAPLTLCDRNIIQGCCPIKIIETMACKTAIIASNIPVVKELVSEKEAVLFEPDREQDLARCIRFILDEPDKRIKYIDKAFNKIQNEFTWSIQQDKLKQVYNRLK
ncbi:glycosyltransferase [Tenacibaculum ovolyticum]|uniref:glycosyltransferase n=1 Tax=Tenacibaculum ovolyticum TaxID=104270 RepID=UPI0003F6AA95|nr:glycosyltransferase [Tenacibaculum ovolyticum]